MLVTILFRRETKKLSTGHQGTRTSNSNGKLKPEKDQDTKVVNFQVSTGDNL